MIEITLGGEVRQMRFSHLAIKTLENHYKIPFHSIFNVVNIDSIDNIGVMLWASFRKFDKSITLDEVEEMLDDDIDEGKLTYEELGDKVKLAFQNSAIVKEAKKKVTTTKKTTKKPIGTKEKK